MARNLKYPPRNQITRPKLIVCEGPSDEAFLRALMKRHSLPECSIRNNGDADNTGRGGIDKFEKMLIGMQSWKGFPSVTDILVVADNDMSPDVNFAKVRSQIADAKIFSVPDAPLEKKGTNPSITILMIPWTDKKGNLECLCLEAASDANKDLASCVDDFANRSGAEKWPEITLVGKMKLRSLLSVSHKPDPFIGLGNIWNESEATIPLDNGAFKNIADILKQFMS